MLVPTPPFEKDETASVKLIGIPPTEVYRFLGTYWLYQDKIGWSRIQTLYTVEAAILAGAFLRRGPLSSITLILGSLIIEWIYRLIQRDWEVRDLLSMKLDEVNKEYSLDLIPNPGKNSIRGRTVVKRIYGCGLALNFLLALLKCWQWYGGGTDGQFIVWLLT